MDLTPSGHQKFEAARQALLQLVAVAACGGCAAGGTTDVYRESRGEVARYSVKQTDPVLRVALFIKLSDGTIRHPVMYYYQAHYTLIGVRQVEKSARLFQSTSPKHRDFIYLPVAKDKEIDTLLFLLRKPISKAERQDGDRNTKSELTDWLLLEVDSHDISPDHPIKFPSYDDLASREASKQQQDLLRELTKRYDVLEAADVTRMNTPVRPGDKRPWWTW